MELFITIILYIFAGIAILGWGSVLFCWCLFGYAKYKGWLTDDITPAQIMEKIQNG